MSRWVRMVLVLVGCGVWAGSVAGADLPPLEGLLEPNEVVKCSSQTPGILEQLTVERGDQVKKGQVLARLKSGVEKAVVNRARARVEFGQRKAQRNAELYKKQLLSLHDKDELETEIRQAQLELIEAEERLKLRTIQSTVDGVVVKRTGAPGDYVGEESFLTVASIDPLNVEVIVPAAYFGAIHTDRRHLYRQGRAHRSGHRRGQRHFRRPPCPAQPQIDLTGRAEVPGGLLRHLFPCPRCTPNKCTCRSNQRQPPPPETSRGPTRLSAPCPPAEQGSYPSLGLICFRGALTATRSSSWADCRRIRRRRRIPARQCPGPAR